MKMELMKGMHGALMGKSIYHLFWDGKNFMTTPLL